jgi:hypothetical protein
VHCEADHGGTHGEPRQGVIPVAVRHDGKLQQLLLALRRPQDGLLNADVVSVVAADLRMY